jgi:hypothetical protein
MSLVSAQPLIASAYTCASRSARLIKSFCAAFAMLHVGPRTCQTTFWCACRSAHLTNDAVQKKIEHYGRFEDSNKLSMRELQAALGPRLDVQVLEGVTLLRSL